MGRKVLTFREVGKALEGWRWDVGHMSQASQAYRSITKAALAALVGIPEEDLLTRAQAAKEIGVSPGYLANLAQPDDEGVGGGPAYYRSTTSPTGGTSWYPRRDVEAFRDHRRSKIKSTYRGRLGQQDWIALEDEKVRVPVHVLVKMVAEWKAADLYRRAERYAQGRSISGDEFAEYQRERVAILPAESPLSFCEDDVMELLTAKATAIWGAEHHHLLPIMLRAAWREVIMHEERWGVGDLESLPTSKPLTY